MVDLHRCESSYGDFRAAEKEIETPKSLKRELTSFLFVATNSNGGHYTRGDAVQYDAWAKLLPGSSWGWDKVYSYMKKVRSGLLESLFVD